MKTIRPIQTTSIGMFDAPKGILMLLIMFGHALTAYFHYWEYSPGNDPVMITATVLGKTILFGLTPMFFIVCGFGFRKTTMKRCADQQKQFFWKPYLLTAAAITLLAAVKKLLLRGDLLEGFRFNALPYLLAYCPGERPFLGLYMDSIGPIWFFVVFILGSLLLNLVLQEERFWAQCLLVIMLGTVGVQIRNITLPFCIQQTMICTGYLFVGWLMKKKKFLQSQIPVYLILVTLVVCMILNYHGNIEVSQNVWEQGHLDWLLSYPMGIVMLCLLLQINHLPEAVTDVLGWIGRNALYICCIHTVDYTVVPWDKVAEKMAAHKATGFFAESIAHLTIALGGCAIIELIKHRIMQKEM